MRTQFIINIVALAANAMSNDSVIGADAVLRMRRWWNESGVYKTLRYVREGATGATQIPKNIWNKWALLREEGWDRATWFGGWWLEYGRDTLAQHVDYAEEKMGIHPWLTKTWYLSAAPALIWYGWNAVTATTVGYGVGGLIGIGGINYWRVK
jgi:hypothetical protein